MSTTPKNENVETLIYVLKDPETKVMRYVGKTVHTLQRRLSQHLYDSRTKEKRNHRLNWNLKGKTKSLIFGDTKLKINYKELPTFQVIEKSVQDKNGEG